MQNTMERSEVMLLRLVLMALTTLSLISAQDDWDQRCGSLCNCKWFSGKKTAACVGQKLTHVPTNLSSEIQILDLTDNRIPYVPRNAFSDTNLVNLHKIVLRECKIESVDARAFNGLKIVIEIDLASNRITRIDPGTFVETQRLRILRLNDNALEFLENEQFHDLPYIQKIVLSHNRLSRVGEKAFSNLPGLQSLSLNGNNLSILSLGSFDRLPKLSSLDLHENPWSCDCRLKEFREWTLERRLHTRTTRCDQPANLAGRMWDDVASEELDCRRPDIQVVPGFDLEKDGGSGDVMLWCRVMSGLARPQLSWIHGSIILKNSTERRQGAANLRGGYVLTESGEWLNLTIPDASAGDKGDYVCMATSSGGSVERTVTLTIADDVDDGTTIGTSLPLALALGGATLLLVLLLVVLVGFAWYRRRGDGDKSTEEGNPADRHGFGAAGPDLQGKSSIAAVNPGKLAAQSHGSLVATTELNGTLEGSDSVFAVDGPTRSVKPATNEERGFHAGDPDTPSTPTGRGTSRGHLPPDLLAFRASPGESSPARQASPIDAGFRTLPGLNRSFGPTSPHYNSGLAVMLRHGYVTIPRRPRPPSWGSGCSPPPGRPAAEAAEPLYDNLGQRTTADGSSVLSLNKSPEPVSPNVRGRPLPRTPTGINHPLLYSTVQRSTPNILTSSPLDRSAPEGAPGWPARFPDETDNRIVGNVDCQTLGRKLPPRPPPKPENRTPPPGPLFEDEGEDGTEV